MKSIIQGDSEERCYICGKHPNHIHHMLHGSMRKAADKYGLTCHLCAECHQRLHDKGIKDRELQIIAQAHFEELYGHEKYMEIFGKSFV